MEASTSSIHSGVLLDSQDAFYCAKFVHLLHTMRFIGFSSVMFYNEVRLHHGAVHFDTTELRFHALVSCLVS